MVDDDDDGEEEECSTIVDAVEDDGWFERRGLGVANAFMMDGSSWIRRRMRERMLVDFIVSICFLKSACNTILSQPSNDRTMFSLH